MTGSTDVARTVGTTQASTLIALYVRFGQTSQSVRGVSYAALSFLLVLLL